MTDLASDLRDHAGPTSPTRHLHLVPPPSEAPKSARGRPRYRFAFALTTSLGNVTRYINFRKYAVRDPEVTTVWAPITHYLDPDPYRHLPGRIRAQCVLMHEARAILKQWRSLDAVMVHAFQLFATLSLMARSVGGPALVWSQDYAPMRDPSLWQDYGQRVPSKWMHQMRHHLDAWLTRQADLYVPFSHWAAERLVDECRVQSSRVRVINVGVDLELWPYREQPLPHDGERLRVLFVGGDFARKGGDLLLDVVHQHFRDRVEVHLVSAQAPRELPPNVIVHRDLAPNGEGLRRLYADCHVFALPTTADMAPQVLMEAMATGLPIVTTSVGAIPEMVIDGLNGFVIQPRDGQALREHLQTLLDQPKLARRMGRAGRTIVEQRFSAETSTSKILAELKQLADRRRSSFAGAVAR